MTPQLLAEIYQIPLARAKIFAPVLVAVFKAYPINSLQRKACFLAQVGHESGKLRWLKEIWGPTKQQRRYEPVTTLSRTLDNTLPGSGKRFMGRGAIQTTGYANYRLVTKRLRRKFPDCPDFVKDPAALERPFWALMSAGDFWEMRNLNKWADAYDFTGLTKRVNGGYNGLADRQFLYNRIYVMLMMLEE